MRGADMNLFEIIGYPLYGIAALELYLGALLLRQNPRRSPVNKSVAAFSFFSAVYTLCNAVAYTLAAQGRDFNFFNRAAWIGWLMMPACLQFLFFLKDEKSVAARRIGAVLYPFWAAVLVATLATDLVEPGDLSLIPYVARTGPLEDLFRLIGTSMLVWIIAEVVRLRRQVTGVKKAQLNYFFHGTLIFAAGGAFVVGLLPVAGGFGVDPSFGSYFSAPWVVLTFFAITRYRLFDLRLVVTRAVSIAVLFAIVALAQTTLFRLLSPPLGPSLAIALSLALIGLFFAVTSLSGKVQMIAQALIVRGKYAYQEILREATMAVIAKLDLDELLNTLVSSMRRALAAENVCLFLRSDDGQYRLRHGFGVREAVANARPLDAAVIEFLPKSDRPAVREELERMLPDKEFGPVNGQLKLIGAELILPLIFKGRLGGLITVGAKGSGEPYVQSDIDLLEALAVHAAVAIENARLYDDALRTRESLKETESRYQELFDNTIRKYLSP
jgi:GAF domain-containing protein